MEITVGNRCWYGVGEPEDEHEQIPKRDDEDPGGEERESGARSEERKLAHHIRMYAMSECMR